MISYVLDGVTLNHVGEVVYDIEETRAYRRLCPRVYENALKELVFALFVADRIWINPRTWNRLAEPEDPHEPNRMVALELSRAAKSLVDCPKSVADVFRSTIPQETISNRAGDRVLSLYIDYLNDPFYRSATELSWRHLFERDYLKEHKAHPEFFERRAAPTDYKFRDAYLKSTKAFGAILNSQFLLPHVPSMMKLVERTSNGRSPVRQATEAFLLQVACSHLGIHVNYEAQIDQINTISSEGNIRCIYQPADTRSRLVEAVHGAGFQTNSKLDRSKAENLPNLLTLVLQASIDAPTKLVTRAVEVIDELPSKVVGITQVRDHLRRLMTGNDEESHSGRNEVKSSADVWKQCLGKIENVIPIGREAILAAPTTTSIEGEMSGTSSPLSSLSQEALHAHVSDVAMTYFLRKLFPATFGALK